MPASRADPSGHRRNGVQMEKTFTFRFRIAVAGMAAFFSIGLVLRLQNLQSYNPVPGTIVAGLF